jgi:uncharacterized protein (DUF983 family)
MRPEKADRRTTCDDGNGESGEYILIAVLVVGIAMESLFQLRILTWMHPAIQTWIIAMVVVAVMVVNSM